MSLTYEPFASFPRNKLSLIWIDQANPKFHRFACVSLERHVLAFIISKELHLCHLFRHSSRYNITHVQSEHLWQPLTCTPRHHLPSKLCLMRQGLREDFLRTYSSLLLYYIKWPLCIRYSYGTNLLLVWGSFANFDIYLIKGAESVKEIAMAWSGPPLSSNVLNVCIEHVAYVSMLMSLQQHGQTHPNKSNCIIPL